MTDVFISYSRKDKEFALRLHEALTSEKYDVWIDQKKIQHTAVWRNAIKTGIEGADAFIFIVSPDSVNSKYCNWEIDYAVRHNKRLIPIEIRKGFTRGSVRSEISEIQWLPFYGEMNFDKSFKALIDAIELDLDDISAHTRLLKRAIEWEQQGKDDSFLLRGRDLEKSEEWLQKKHNKSSAPTEQQVEFITVSQALRDRQQAHEEDYEETKQQLRNAVVYNKPKIRQVFLASFATSALVVIARFLGVLQSLELVAFDGLLQLKPVEEQDDKILIVQVTEADFRAQQEEEDQGGGTLSDTRLNQLLQILEPYSPRVIGLDFYRDVGTRLPELAQRMTENERFIALCRVPELDKQGQIKPDTGIAHPPEVPPHRVGFSDIIFDQDRAVRRQLLLQETVDGSPCNAESSFSLQLAKHYLGLDVQDSVLKEEGIFLEDTIFPRLNPHIGAYQLETFGGYQILMNYRLGPNGDISQAFQRVSLGSILEGQVSEADIKDKLIIVGVAAESYRNLDPFATPYSRDDKELPGVILQAQMTSQLINAVLEGRPLIWVWPFEGEIVWIWGWALVGGIIARHCRRRLHFGLLIMLAFGVLTGGCCVLMIQTAGWVPLVPSTLSLMITGGGLISLAFRPAPEVYAAETQSNAKETQDSKQYTIGTTRR